MTCSDWHLRGPVDRYGLGRAGSCTARDKVMCMRRKPPSLTRDTRSISSVSSYPPPFIIGADDHSRCSVEFTCFELFPMLLLVQHSPAHVRFTVPGRVVAKRIRPCCEHVSQIWTQSLHRRVPCALREWAHFAHHCFQQLLSDLFPGSEQSQQVMSAVQRLLSLRTLSGLRCDSGR